MRCWCVVVAAALASVLGCLPDASAQASFIAGTLVGETSGSPTSLQWGPDGRLYVGQQNGAIKVYGVGRTAPGAYEVTSTQTITSVQNLVNHDDIGQVRAATNRVLTGILVTGTASNPVIYATSSDPRIAVADDDGSTDTNSSVISRLTWVGSGINDPNGFWNHLDLVRGLPRSEENHAANGMSLDAGAQRLYVAVGGNTNMGAPSNNFGLTPEYALSAAILVIDLAHPLIGTNPYELPTLDDPTRANETRLFNGTMQEVDVRDPWGGNDGLNQAVIDATGPVQVYAGGFRNPYDLVLTSAGKLYTIDNGPNGGWGGPPLFAGGLATDLPNEDDSRGYGDGIHYVGDVDVDPAQTYYGGHPNPYRAGATVNGDPTLDPVPASHEDLREGIYLRPAGTGSPPAPPHDGVNDGLGLFSTSSNGLVEYRGTNFGGELLGDLLVARWNGKIDRIDLNAAGDTVLGLSTLFTPGDQPLDVTALGDLAAFPGTIWAVNHRSGVIHTYEPADFSLCTGSDSPGLDEDGDGFNNADEIDNGTAPCSPASAPTDADGDFLSDLNDADDDNDGTMDHLDFFALDSMDGLTTAIPLDYGWGVGEPGFGLEGLGFTGMMVDGVRRYDEQYDPDLLAAGGAAGVFSVESVTMGDALGASNNQDNAFQLGVNVSAATGIFEVSTAVRAPFFGPPGPAGSMSQGLFIGAGDQDDYVKVVVSANGGAGGVLVVQEVAGVPTSTMYGAALVGDVLSANFIELFLLVDPVQGTVQPRVSLDGGAQVAVGPALAAGPQLLTSVQDPGEGLAVGIISTTGPGGLPFSASWDYLRVLPIGATAEAFISIGSNGIDSSTYNSGSFRITNTSTGGQAITRVTLDISTSVFPDVIFDPGEDELGRDLEPAGDNTLKAFEVNSIGGTGTIAHDYLESYHNGVVPIFPANPAVDAAPFHGYDRLEISYTDFDPGETMTFSIDNDPNSVRQTSAPGPNEAGSISGLELGGSIATVEFDDGTVLIGQVFRVPGSTGISENTMRTAPAPAPLLEAVGIGAGPVTTANPNQTIRVYGPAGANVRLVRIEGGMFVTGMSGPHPDGFDIDPFEANSTVAVAEYAAAIGAGGFVDVPVVLTRYTGDGGYTPGPNDELGLNHFVAAVSMADGRMGLSSGVLVLQLVDADLTLSDDAINFGALVLGDAATQQITVFNNSGAAVDVTGLGIDHAAFTLVSPPALPATIPSDGQLPLTVRFAPSVLGPAAGTLSIDHDGVGGTLEVLLSGSGVAVTGNILYRVNAGGPLVGAIDGGPDWAADTNVNPSPYHNGGTNTSSYGTMALHSSVPPTTPAAVFSSIRWDNPTGTDMVWTFPVGAGAQVEVRVYVGNGFGGTSDPGERIYDIAIEGSVPPSMDNVDPSGMFGHLVGGMVSHTVTVGADGLLDIHFLHIIQTPLVSAIEIVTPQTSDQLDVTVELGPVISTGTSPDTITRCITFELFECGNPTPVIVDAEMDFTVQDGLPTTATATILVPAGDYECITARDALHTLRTTDADDFLDSGETIAADFTGPPTSGGDWLVGGNLNDDRFIDILDFGIFIGAYGQTPGSDTACPIGGPHADVGGDGLVDASDFNFISINFLDGSEPNCCGLPGAMVPVERISVAELQATGRGELAAADLNGDGWLDQLDVVEYLDGALEPCEADLNDDDVVDVFDLLAYLNEWFETTPAADINDDGAIDVFDLLDFLDLWFQGC